MFEYFVAQPGDRLVRVQIDAKTGHTERKIDAFEGLEAIEEDLYVQGELIT